jgi:hypothetical protein
VPGFCSEAPGQRSAEPPPVRRDVRIGVAVDQLEIVDLALEVAHNLVGARQHGFGGDRNALIGDDDRIAGFAMVGSEADGVMAVVETAMLAGFPYTTLRDAILTHPTMAEGLNFLFWSVPSRTKD